MACLVALAAACAQAEPQEHASTRPVMARPPADRIAEWGAEGGARVMPASISFREPISFVELRAFLEARGLVPYQVHMRVAGLSGAPWVPQSEASMAVLETAHAQAVELVLEGLCDDRSWRARIDADSVRADSAAYRWRLNALVARQEARREALEELRRDDPLIHGVKVVGAPAAIDAILGLEEVTRIEPGARVTIRGSEVVVVPDPLAVPAHTGVLTLEARSAEEATHALEALAADRPAECSDFDALRGARTVGTGRGEEARPRS